jgi:MarR family transcriptional regulator, organic hydroperoxide resistance regulator
MADRSGGDAWLDSYVPYLLYRVTNKLNARLLTRLRSTKTNPARWRVLSVLRAFGPLRISDIVSYTLMGQPTVSRVIDQLVREGRVARGADPDDSRATRVTLTAKGAATFEAIVPSALRHQALALEGLTRKDVATIVRILSRIESNIDETSDVAVPRRGR